MPSTYSSTLAFRGGRRLVGAGLAAATLASAGLLATGGTVLAAAPAAQPAAASSPSNVQRVSGATRIDTAIAASKDQFPSAASALAQ